MKDKTPDRRNVPEPADAAVGPREAVPPRSAAPEDPRLRHQQVHQAMPEAPSSQMAQQLVAGFVAPIEFMMRQLIREAIAPLPKVTPEEVEAAVELGVQNYHESSNLEKRIEELARRLSEEIAGAKVAEVQRTVEALPKVTPHQVEGAVDQGVQKYHESNLLEKRIADLSRSLAEGIATAKVREIERRIEALPKVTPEQVAEAAAAVRHAADARAKRIEDAVGALPKVTPEQVAEAAAAVRREADERAKKIEDQVAALPKVTPEQVETAVSQGVLKYHDSPFLDKRITGLAEEIAGAKVRTVEQRIEALPKVTPEQVREAAAEVRRAADERAKKIEDEVAALPKVTPEQVVEAAADVRRSADERAKRLEEALAALPKVTPEQVQEAAAEAVHGFQESPELEKRIDETARRLAEEIVAARTSKTEETIAAIPRVTLGQVDSAIQMKLEAYQESGPLQDRIRDLARRMADERVRDIERAIEAIPRITPEQVDTAIGKGLQKYHDSPLLDARIGELARFAAVEVSQEKSRNLEQALEGLPKVTTAQVESSVRIAIQDYHQSRELRDRIEEQVHRVAEERVRRLEQLVGGLPKFSPEQIELFVGRGVKKYHESPELSSRIQGLARTAAEEIANEKLKKIEAVVAAAPKVTPESIDQAVAHGVQKIQESAQQRERAAEDRLRRVEETVVALPKFASEQLDAAKNLRSAEERVRKVEESLAAAPKLTAEQIAATNKELRAAAERVRKLEETVASIPKVTPDLLDAAVGKGLQKVADLPELQKRIIELAQRVAVERVKKVEESVAALPKMGPAEVQGVVDQALANLPQSAALKDWVVGIAAQKVGESVAALPKMGPKEVQGVVDQALANLPQSAALKDWVSGIAAQKVADSTASAVPITPDDVANTVRKSLEESLQSPQWAERIRQATEEMFQEASASAARSAVEDSRTAAREEVESHHASEQFARRVEKQARQVVMGMIAPESILELVRQALEELRSEMPKAQQEQFAPAEEVPVFVLPEGQDLPPGARQEDGAAAGAGESLPARMTLLMERLALLESQLRGSSESASSRYHSFTRKRVGRR